jgi:epoxyqueuosine reductase
VDAGSLKKVLQRKGATLVGIGDVTRALSSEIVHLNIGVAIAINRSLGRETVEQLTILQQYASDWLKAKGFRSLVIPPDSDRKKDKYITKLYRLFCHKTAATCSGLGWIGKNGLLINRQYGSRLSWATVLTDAPLETDEPTSESECGECELCVTHCPSKAVKGHLWSLGDPLMEMVMYEKCRALKKTRTPLEDKPNCGFCITVCPYSRNAKKTNKL